MSKLVQDLLMLARADEGQLGRDPVALPVREILERARSQVLRPGSAPVMLDGSADPALSVRGNQGELIRLFSNLLENAVRYTAPSGQICVTAERAGAETRIRVADTGIGIAAEHLTHLGERFYRADAARTRQDGGTGLGLAISRSIVEAHGGSLTFQSQVNQGTVVCVTLPVSEP
jgi:signal transduction histidine kinase